MVKERRLRLGQGVMRGSDYLAMIDNYHLTRKNATFRFVIWNGQLWGERFQMAVIGERLGTGGNGREPSG